MAARADRACANVSPEVKEAARALLLESDWEARIKSKLPDSFPDPPAPASAAFPDDALAACSAEGKAAAVKAYMKEQLIEGGSSEFAAQQVIDSMPQSVIDAQDHPYFNK